MSATHDTNGRPYAKLSELQAGDTIILDGGFTCKRQSDTCLVMASDDGLYFPCDCGRHYLSGQADDGEHCVGVYRCE